MLEMRYKGMEKILSEAIRVAKLAGMRIKELRENKGYDEYLKNGYELVTTADLEDSLNSYKVVVSSPGVFDELKAILTSVL